MVVLAVTAIAAAGLTYTALDRTVIQALKESRDLYKHEANRLQGIEEKYQKCVQEAQDLKSKNNVLEKFQCENAVSVIESRKKIVQERIDVLETEQKNLTEKISHLEKLSTSKQEDLEKLRSELDAINTAIKTLRFSEFRFSGAQIENSLFENYVILKRISFLNEMSIIGSLFFGPMQIHYSIFRENFNINHATFIKDVSIRNSIISGKLVISYTTAHQSLFDNADLRGSIFKKTDLRGADLSGAIIDETTILPKSP